MYALYLFDVYVSQLTLNKEIYVDTYGAPLVIKVAFINLPIAEITERSRFRKSDDVYAYEFKGGQSCQFSALCEELVKTMKKTPLNIGVFRLDDNFPICGVRTYLTGCACDLNTLLVQNPKSFVFRGPFDLIDSGNSFGGQLSATITVTNMGRCMVRRYALVPNCFLFKIEPEENEYKCSFKENVTLSNSHRTMNLDADSPDSLIRDISGISPIAGYLALGCPPPRPPREPLVDPRAPRSRKGKRKKGKKK